MTDRLIGCTVVFDKDIREDDAEVLLQSIRCLKRVVKVEPVISDSASALAEMRATQNFIEKTYEFLVQLRKNET